MSLSTQPELAPSPRLRPMTGHHYNTLTLELDGAVALLSLNRPDKRNAISYELIDDVLLALDEVQKSSTAHVLILTGAGNAFCSGMDLDNLRAITKRTEEEILPTPISWRTCFARCTSFPR